MNRNRWIAFLAAVVVVGLVSYETLRPRIDEDLAAQLAQRQASSSETPQTQVLPDKPATAEPPADMVVSWIPPEKIWFVGKYEDGGGVEIPFRPGERPAKSKVLAPVGENPGFVGPDQCQECHREKYQSFTRTAHYKTSSLVNDSTIDGSFEEGNNRLKTSDPNVSFEMIRRGDVYLQKVQFFDWSFEVPMEIIMGSSKMAQTYLYWHQDGLYQHNVTHITDGNQWVNSPGYIDGDAAYARPIPQRCLECHMTYFDFRGNVNRYTPDSFIFGVTCERCHGPGREHVTFHQKNRDVRKAVGITNPADLERQIQMEICGQCHGGTRQLKGDALSFRPGDRLDEHYHPPVNELEVKNSVHTSNQLTRLSQSECFRQSQMTCIDCHDPHHNERGDQKLFSKRCMNCHQSESDCGYFPQEGINFADNCVDCHMPQRATEKLRLKSVEGDIFPPLRDHLIRVDQEATQAFLSKG